MAKKIWEWNGRDTSQFTLVSGSSVLTTGTLPTRPGIPCLLISGSAVGVKSVWVINDLNLSAYSRWVFRGQMSIDIQEGASIAIFYQDPNHLVSIGQNINASSGRLSAFKCDGNSTGSVVDSDGCTRSVAATSSGSLAQICVEVTKGKHPTKPSLLTRYLTFFDTDVAIRKWVSGSTEAFAGLSHGDWNNTACTGAALVWNVRANATVPASASAYITGLAFYQSWTDYT